MANAKHFLKNEQPPTQAHTKLPSAKRILCSSVAHSHLLQPAASLLGRKRSFLLTCSPQSFGLSCEGLRLGHSPYKPDVPLLNLPKEVSGIQLGVSWRISSVPTSTSSPRSRAERSFHLYSAVMQFRLPLSRSWYLGPNLSILENRAVKKGLYPIGLPLHVCVRDRCL